MNDVSEQFLRALSADELTSDEAAATFDDAALQVFWRKWPPLARGRGPCGDSSTRTWPDRPWLWANLSWMRWVARAAEGRRDRDRLRAGRH
jgi:hypothetical protein